MGSRCLRQKAGLSGQGVDDVEFIVQEKEQVRLMLLGDLFYLCENIDKI